MDVDRERKRAKAQLRYQRHGRRLLVAADQAIDAGDAKAARDNLDSHEAMWRDGVAQGLTKPIHQFQSVEHMCAETLRKRVGLLEAGEPLPAKHKSWADAAAWGRLSEAMQKSVEASAPINLDTGEIVRQDVALAMARMEAKHPLECSCRKDDPQGAEKYREAISLLHERGERLPDTWRVPTTVEYWASRGL